MSRTAGLRTCLLLVAAASLLAACSFTPTVYYSRIYYDSWPDFFSGGYGKEFRAVIAGNPFDADKARTDQVVLSAAQQAFNRAGYGFTTTPGEIKPLDPYLGVVFNAEHTASGLPCGDPSRLSLAPAPSGHVTIQAALCRAGAPLTAAKGAVSNVRGPDDPRFRALVYQIAVKLFRPPIRSGSGAQFAASEF